MRTESPPFAAAEEAQIRPSLFRRISQALLRHRVLLCLGLALVIFLPVLRGGFAADDLWHQALLDRRERGEDTRSTFDFCLDFWSWTARPAPVGGTFLRSGSPYALTWFAQPETRIRFFRPFSAWTILLNHEIGGAKPFGYHAVGLALWLLLVVAVLKLHRTLLPDTPENRAVLLLAGIFFVLDESHVVDVSMVAARHGLLDVLLSVTCLILYVRYRQTGGAWRLALSFACLVLALCAGETAVTTLFWIAAWEIFVAEDPIRTRLLRSLPFVGLIVAFVVLYGAAGFGSAGSGWYLSPFEEPLTLARAAITERLPAYLMGALTFVPAELSHIAPGPVTWLGMLLALLLLIALAAFVRKRPPLLAAAVASLASIGFLCTVRPFNYKLLFPSIGISLVLGAFVIETWRRLRTDRPGRWRTAGLGAAVAIIVLIHGLAAPYLATYLVRTSEWTRLPRTAEGWRQSFDWPEERETADVYLLNSPGAWTSVFLPYQDFQNTRRWLREYVPISFEPVETELTRLDDRTVRLRADAGFLSGYFSRAMTSAARPTPLFRAGEKFERSGLAVSVDSVRDGNPTTLTVRFPRDLDDPQVWLLGYDGTRTRRIPAPKVGDTARLIVNRPK